MRSKFWITLIGLLALALTGSVVAQMTLEEIILTRDEAMNAGDVETTLSFYADDATYVVIGGPDPEPLVLTGEQAINDRLTFFAQGNASYEATVLGIIDNTARAFTKWSFDGLRADGFEYLDSFEEFVFEDGKIVEHINTVLRLVPLETTVAPFPMPFAAELSGDQMVPPVDTSGSGQASAMLIGDLLVVAGNYEGLSTGVFNQGTLSRPGIEIHRAPAGENGNTERARAEQLIPGLRNLRMFSDAGTSGSFHGAFKLTPEQIQDLETGNYYLVVHTRRKAPGELRGQLLPTAMVDLGPGDLVGLWENQSLAYGGTYFQFSEDGTFIIATSLETMEDAPIERGVYQLDGHRFTLTAEYANTVECTGATGTYTVMLTTDEQLHFFPHADECPYRLEDLQGSLLLPVPQ